MKKRWFHLFAIVPLIGILLVTNIYEDPANIFHNDSVSIANAILDGNATYFESGNGDERAVKLALIEGMPKHVECITIGPSLSMGIRNFNVGTDSYYNLSASSLNFYEYLAEFGLLQINDVHADRVIFCVDTYFFDENMYLQGSINDDMMKYAAYMQELLDGNSPNIPSKNTWEDLRVQLEQAFSITYFQSSVAFIQSNNSYKLPNKRWGIVDENTENFAHYLSDASWVYDLPYRSRTAEEVLTESDQYNIEKQFSKGEHISEYSMEIFNKLIDYLQGQGTVVEFYLCPLSPALWDRMESNSDADKYFILDEVETFALKVANEKGIKVTGSYNPYNVGITNADFLDARHVRHDMLEKYFDFKE